jgi:predicted O-methyltransferase YrrM
VRRGSRSRALQLLHDRWRWGPLGTYIWLSRQVPGWTRGAEALTLADACASLRDDAVVVEIGAFLGSGTILLAGACKLRGSGHVHVVDPFDASGESYSIPIYREIERASRVGLRQRFDDNIRRAGLSAWVSVHQGRDTEVARSWATPISLLFLDGDQSERGARAAYESWSQFIEPRGIIAVHNSRADAHYAQDHDGLRRLVEERIHAPQYADIQCIGSTTFARKLTRGA